MIVTSSAPHPRQAVNVESEVKPSILDKYANCIICSRSTKKWLCSLQMFFILLKKTVTVEFLKIPKPLQWLLNHSWFMIRFEDWDYYIKNVVLPLKESQIQRKSISTFCFDGYLLKYGITESNVFWKSLIFSNWNSDLQISGSRWIIVSYLSCRWFIASWR